MGGILSRHRGPPTNRPAANRRNVQRSHNPTTREADNDGQQAVQRSVTRRTVVGGAAATALTAAGFQAVPAYAGGSHGGGHGGQPRTVRLSVMGTTDLHGNVFNWDYFKNAEYDDTAHNDIGLAKISTLVKAVRARIAKERRTPAPLMLDAGDTIQGTPLAYYFAKIEPITGGHTAPDGRRDERDRVRRRRARQPRVQLRARHPPQVPAAAEVPAARRQRAGLDHRAARSSRRTCSSASTCPARSRSRSASSA